MEEKTTFFKQHSTLTHLIAGGFGGGLTAVLSTPFDTIKVRMQTQVYATAAEPNPSVMHIARGMLKVN